MSGTPTPPSWWLLQPDLLGIPLHDTGGVNWGAVPAWGVQCGGLKCRVQQRSYRGPLKLKYHSWFLTITYGCTASPFCVSATGFFFFFKKRFYLFIFREGKGRREGEKHQCVVASCAPPTGDLACNPGMCPDWESNWWPFGSRPALNPLSHTSQGYPTVFISFNRCPSNTVHVPCTSLGTEDIARSSIFCIAYFLTDFFLESKVSHLLPNNCAINHFHFLRLQIAWHILIYPLSTRSTSNGDPTIVKTLISSLYLHVCTQAYMSFMCHLKVGDIVTLDP